VVRVFQIAVFSFGWIGAVDEVEVMEMLWGEFASWSLVDAIWARRDARSLSRSVVGYEWSSTMGTVVGGADDDDDDVDGNGDAETD
jgi:hypothetical protein